MPLGAIYLCEVIYNLPLQSRRYRLSTVFHDIERLPNVRRSRGSGVRMPQVMLHVIKVPVVLQHPLP
jgi:hypothetical protein